MSDMNRVIVIGATVAAAIGIPTAALAAPAVPTKVPLVNDCGKASINGDCAAPDLVGTFAGVVKFRHKDNGDLRLMIVVKDAPKQTPYQLDIHCGPSPAAPGALATSLTGAVQTDDMGAAVAGPFEIPAKDLEAACGAQAIGHIQLTNAAAGSILSAAPIEVTS